MTPPWNRGYLCLDMFQYSRKILSIFYTNRTQIYLTTLWRPNLIIIIIIILFSDLRLQCNQSLHLSSSPRHEHSDVPCIETSWVEYNMWLPAKDQPRYYPPNQVRTTKYNQRRTTHVIMSNRKPTHRFTSNDTALHFSRRFWNLEWTLPSYARIVAQSGQISVERNKHGTLWDRIKTFQSSTRAWKYQRTYIITTKRYDGNSKIWNCDTTQDDYRYKQNSGQHCKCDWKKLIDLSKIRAELVDDTSDGFEWPRHGDQRLDLKLVCILEDARRPT